MSAVSAAGSRPHMIYSGSATNWPMVIFTSVLAIPLGISLPLLGAPSDSRWSLGIPAALVLIGVAANILTASSVRATAGPNGVTVHWGLVGWPRLAYSLDDIEQAEVIDLRWWAVSWGLWWTPRRTCCTVRSGPTLRLHLCSGRTVTVSVPAPDAAVRAIEAGRAR